MNTSKLADIAEITSSVAILITLVFLVVQMQQNTEALEANGLQAALAADIQYQYKLIEYPNIALSRLKPELSLEEQVQMGLHLSVYFKMREHDWLRLQNGTLGEGTWEAYSRPIPLVLSTQRSRNWWRDASAIYDPSFVTAVNKLIESVSASDQYSRILWAD